MDHFFSMFLQFSMLFSIVQFSMFFSIVQYSVLYSIVQCSVQYSIVQYSFIYIVLFTILFLYIFYNNCYKISADLLQPYPSKHQWKNLAIFTMHLQFVLCNKKNLFLSILIIFLNNQLPKIAFKIFSSIGIRSYDPFFPPDPDIL